MSLSSHDSAIYEDIVARLRAEDPHLGTRTALGRHGVLPGRAIRRLAALVALGIACVLFLFGQGSFAILAAVGLLLGGSWMLHAPIGQKVLNATGRLLR